MQAQGHAQMVVRLAAYGQNPQEAVDAPRFQVLAGREVAIETDFPAAALDELPSKGAQGNLTRAIESQIAANMHELAAEDGDSPRARLERRARYNASTGPHASSGLTNVRVFSGLARAADTGDSVGFTRFLLEQQLDLPFSIGRGICRPTETGPGVCPCCGHHYGSHTRHLLNCQRAGCPERYEKHQKVQFALMSIARDLGLYPHAGRSGGGPCIRVDRKQPNKRTDVAFNMLTHQGLLVHTDVTCVGASPAGRQSSYNLSR